MFGHFDMAPAGQRLDLHKKHGDPMAHILVIDHPAMPGSHGDGRMHFTHQLLARLVHAHDRKTGIMRQLVNLQQILHGGDKRRVLVGRDFPVFAQVRLQLVFFSDRCTVIVETASTIFSSTNLSAKSRTVQRW